MKCDCLAEEILLISDAKLREVLVAYLNECVPAYFYTAEASTTGKYHPKYALGKGGLVRHTKACVKFADTMLSLEQNETLNECYHDEIIFALIVHDTFKQGLKAEGGHTKFEHPIYAAGALQLFVDKFYPAMSDRVAKISEMVMSHSGQWNRSSRSVVALPKPSTEAEKFVHLCDYLASRSFITVDVNYEPSEEEQTTKEA